MARQVLMTDLSLDESGFGTSRIPYLSFSGADIKIIATVRPYRHEVQFNQSPTTVKLADIQTLSVSTFREKMPVRGLGAIGAKTYTRGPRTVAGSIVFTMFDREVLYDFLRLRFADYDSANVDQMFRYVTIDQIPPFDIILMFANEYGFLAKQVIRGVELSASGQVMSIQDLYTEKTAQYVALDMSPMMPYSKKDGSIYNALEDFDVPGMDSGSQVGQTARTPKDLLGDADIKYIFDKMRNPYK